jgi:hypothetical protein
MWRAVSPRRGDNGDKGDNTIVFIAEIKIVDYLRKMENKAMSQQLHMIWQTRQEADMQQGLPHRPPRIQPPTDKLS